MNGKLVGVFILVPALIVGAAVYYLQVYGFYEPVEQRAGEPEVMLTARESGAPEEIAVEDFQAIDASSSPIRYRACFTTTASPAELSARFLPYEGAEPLVAPGWFDCFDAKEVGRALEEGRATAFTGEDNIEYGIDRVVAVMDDGRGFVWHQINHCGEEVFDGNPPPPGCPAPEQTPAAMPQEGNTDG